MKLTVYRGVHNRQWYWRIRAKNGKCLADSSEGYARKRDCLRMAHKVAAGGYPVEVEEP